MSDSIETCEGMAQPYVPQPGAQLIDPLTITLDNVNEGTQWTASSNKSNRIVVGQSDPFEALSLAMIDAGCPVERALAVSTRKEYCQCTQWVIDYAHDLKPGEKHHRNCKLWHRVLGEAIVTKGEFMVLGAPIEGDDSHNCDAMGCGTFSHVLVRMPSAATSQPQITVEILAEVNRATLKFPTWPTDPLHAIAILGEEFGELTKAMLQFTYEPHKTNQAEVRSEAIQTAAMALRLAMSLEAYVYARCEQHSQQGGAR